MYILDDPALLRFGSFQANWCGDLLQVGISHPQGCIPWWSKTIQAGDSVCPKDCELSGFKDGYNLGRAILMSIPPLCAVVHHMQTPLAAAPLLPCMSDMATTDERCKGPCMTHRGCCLNLLAELAPLLINVEKGSVSRVVPHPLLGAYLNVTGALPCGPACSPQCKLYRSTGWLCLQVIDSWAMAVQASPKLTTASTSPPSTPIIMGWNLCSSTPTTTLGRHSPATLVRLQCRA